MNPQISPEVTKAVARSAIELLHKFDMSGAEAEAIYNETDLPKDKELQPDGLPYGIVDPDYARIFTIARTIAWAEGYAITMHGSFTRDLDMLAVPWTDNPCAPEKLVARIQDAAKLRQTGHPPGVKPQGRLAWTFLLSDTKENFSDPRFVDLSVIPPQPKETTHGIAHTCAGFRAGFESEFKRKPIDQEIWNHAIRSWRDLNEIKEQEQAKQTSSSISGIAAISLNRALVFAAMAVGIKIVQDRFSDENFNDFVIEKQIADSVVKRVPWAPHKNSDDSIELLTLLVEKDNFHALTFNMKHYGIRVFGDDVEVSNKDTAYAIRLAIIYAAAKLGASLSLGEKH